MPGLDSYLVSLGVKGQDVVLSTMEKIRKKGDKLTKTKNTIKLGTAGAAGGAPARGKGSPADLIKQEKQENEKVKKNNKENNEEEKKTGTAMKDAAKKFGEGSKNIASAAASLDPTATLSSINTAIGTSLSGISILGVSLGRVPEGIASLSNSVLAMAKNSMDMAKQSTAAFHQLASRNAAREFYGGNVKSNEQMSRNEMSMLVEAISGSMGKIQKPLADELNKLTSIKDTRALANAGAGNWESTGSDKGWLLQQMSNGLQGMPPSIKQNFQAAMMRQNSDLIQGNVPEQSGAQRNAARLANMEEDQTETMYKKSLVGGETNPHVIGMMRQFNNMQAALYNTGLNFSSAINQATEAIIGMPKAVVDMKNSLKEFVADPSMKRAKQLMSNMKVGN